MAIIDEIRIRQTFDPEGKNGGYKFESSLENAPIKKWSWTSNEFLEESIPCHRIT